MHGPRAAGLSPRGALTAPSLIPAQLRTPSDFSPHHIWEGGERSCCPDTNPACLRFFPCGYPSNRIRAGGRGWHSPRPTPAALRNLLGPAVGDETAVQDSGSRGHGSRDPGTGGATFSAGSWAWPRVGPAPMAWFLPCHVQVLPFSWMMAHPCFSRAPPTLRAWPLQLPASPRGTRAGSRSVLGVLVPELGVLSSLRGLP